MTELGLVVVGLFLPLFPFSMAFNAVFERVKRPLLRSVLWLSWRWSVFLLISVETVGSPACLIP